MRGVEIRAPIVVVPSSRLDNVDRDVDIRATVAFIEYENGTDAKDIASMVKAAKEINDVAEHS